MFHINKPKFRSIFIFVFVGVFIVAFVASSVVPAFAQPLAGVTPHVLWQLSGAYGGPFTADGSAVYLVTRTGFQLNRAADGALLSAITLPASSLGYDASAFSADMQYVALSIRANGITRIELWRVSDGTLARTINTDAVRNARGLDLSLDSGLVAIMERFAYGDGGMLRVYRTSDGALVHKEGPLVQNGNTRVKFSPTSPYLAVYENRNFLGTVIFDTGDWSVAGSIGDNASWLQWAADGSSLWIYGNPFQRVNVAGAVLQSAPVKLPNLYVSAATPDNRYFLTSQAVSTDPHSPPGDTLYELRTSDGRAAVSYKFNSTIVSAGQINPAGTLFTYAICPGDGSPCTFYMAQMP